jgi:hypothetical protein
MEVGHSGYIESVTGVGYLTAEETAFTQAVFLSLCGEKLSRN